MDTNEHFHELIQEIFKQIIPDGKGIEVNTSGFSYGLKQAMPSRDILELYKACGGEIITLGSDSHYADHVGRYFHEMLELLRDIVQYICSFDHKNQYFIQLSNFYRTKSIIILI